MKAEKLVMMANQIAAFFRAQGMGAAPEGVADHLRKFWDPVMRAELAQLASQADQRLDPVVVKAAELLKADG
jgi:formate dehydrogenase subunit delta